MSCHSEAAKRLKNLSAKILRRLCRLRMTFTLLSVFCIVPLAFALNIPNPTGRYVSDFALILSPSAASQLENSLETFERETSNQILVVTMPSLEGGSLEDFSIRLAEKWKAGTQKKDNGAILLIFKEDRAVRIEVGYGLEGALPDIICSQIIQNQIVPAFRAGDYDKGVLSAVESMMAATRGEYKAEPKRDMGNWQSYAYFLMLLYFILPPLFYAVLFALGGFLWGFPGILGALLAIVVLEALRQMWMHGNTLSGGRRPGGWSGTSSGGGFSSGGFSSSGFSGGGGSFGGGGSSGRW